MVDQINASSLMLRGIHLKCFSLDANGLTFSSQRAPRDTGIGSESIVFRGCASPQPNSPPGPHSGELSKNALLRNHEGRAADEKRGRASGKREELRKADIPRMRVSAISAQIKEGLGIRVWRSLTNMGRWL